MPRLFDALQSAVKALQAAGIAGAAGDARALLAGAAHIAPDRLTLHLQDEISPQAEARFAATAFGVLPFLGAGQTHQVGKYQKTVAGGLVFLSGLISRKGTDDSFVPGDMAQQTRTVLENAKVLLKTAGLTLDNVVSSKVFITSDTGFAAMNEVYREFFPSAPPARATIGTGLVSRNALVELVMTAVR